jgi:hypothetical protein
LAAASVFTETDFTAVRISAEMRKQAVDDRKHNW